MPTPGEMTPAQADPCSCFNSARSVLVDQPGNTAWFTSNPPLKKRVRHATPIQSVNP